MGGLSRPHRRTEHLSLVPAGPAHLPLIVSLDADPEVMRHLTGRAVPGAEARPAWADALERRTDVERGLGYWCGFAEEGFVGWWALTTDEDPDVAELGYRLARTAWGLGYATEGARSLVEHARALGLRRVWAETMVVNVGSRRVLEKAGLRHVHTEVRTWDDPVPGWRQGEAVYEIDLR